MQASPNEEATVPHILVLVLTFSHLKPMRRGLIQDEELHTPRKSIFNYRLFRSRRLVENAFKILAARWRVYQRTMQQQPGTVDDIVKATRMRFA